MASRKCGNCGLVNFAENHSCRRCGTALGVIVDEESPAPSVGLGRRILWIFGVTAFLIFCWSRSLLLTSDPIDPAQREMVLEAVGSLGAAGFSGEVVMLRHLANFRATDELVELYVGHRDAYAATNFPLGLVTLYPKFFTVPVDDTERAAILLHEAQHLRGAAKKKRSPRPVGETSAGIGWTADRYSTTVVWKNTREWTAAEVPVLFSCGTDRHSDCFQ